MRSYRPLRILWMQLRTSLSLALQYRADFLTDGFVEVFWTITAIVPLFVVYGTRETIAGWTLGEALMVTGFFTLLQGVLEGAINPSMTLVVEQIRKGTFDFVLLKPLDAQFLVSTSRFLPWRAVNLVTALVMFAFGFARLGRTPAVADVLLALGMLASSVTILYSLWIVSVSLAFWVVKLDNLTFLFGSIFDAARWPSSIFRGVLHVIFTFVVPLAVMTTFPAEALLGRATASRVASSALAALLAFVLSRAVFRRAISKYTSASS